MPLINGCKYSCEPCIRGHRATSCAHTDRVLIEVRKPGRPLQSCGHRLDTCVCGRLSELFKISDILPEPQDNQFIQTLQPPVLVASKYISVSPSTKPKPKSRKNSTSKVTKKSKKKVMSPAASDSASTSPIPIEEAGNLKEKPTKTTPSENSTPSTVDSSQSPRNHPELSSPPPPAPPVITPLPSFQNFIQYNENSYFERLADFQHSPPIQRRDSNSMSFSSRIEDLSIVSPTDFQPYQTLPEPQKVVRSQYIMATQDSMWRAINEQR